MADRTAHGVTAVVPVKRLVRAKSRLLLDDDERADLALAFAVDTVAALLASPLVASVLVVTSDEVAAACLRRLGAAVVRDEGRTLRESVHQGVLEARAAHRGTGVVVVPADLPCLTTDDVTAVIVSAAGGSGAFVPDLDGTGTTLVVLAPEAGPATRYGPRSADEHAALGLRRLDDAPARARLDVDTLEDLRAALALGVGARTRAVLAALDLDDDLRADVA